MEYILIATGVGKGTVIYENNCGEGIKKAWESGEGRKTWKMQEKRKVEGRTVEK